MGKCVLFITDGVEPWSPLGSTNAELLEFVIRLKKGTIQTNNQKYDFTIKTISEIFKVGPIQDSIGHIANSRFKRGVFEMYPIKDNIPNSNTSMWHVISNIQYSMLTNPTHKGIKYINDKKQLEKITEYNSTLFYTLGFGWMSQKLVAVMTTKPMMGGRSWTSLLHKNVNILKTACLWFNSIFGMLIHWSQTSRTQPGRSVARQNALKMLPCPDFTKLPKHKLDQAAKKLDQLRNAPLLPGARMQLDIVRHNIDKAVMDLFDWDIPEQLLNDLRKMISLEPSISKAEYMSLDNDEYIIDGICQNIDFSKRDKEPISIILTNKNVILFNPNIKQLKDQTKQINCDSILDVIITNKSNYSIIDFIIIGTNSADIQSKSDKFWCNNIVGQIDNLPHKQALVIYKKIKKFIR